MTLTIVAVAEICHDANKTYCERLGDFSQESWEYSSDHVRQSAIKGVRAHFENPTMTARDSHASWLACKEKAGWAHGDVKDEKKKTHPCMVPYDQLPEEQRVKDHLFTAICRVFKDACPDS